MKYDYGAYCEVYGKNLYNLVWEYLLVSDEYIIAGDMAEETGISRPKAYQFIEELLKKKYIVKHRMLGRMQIYKLNRENVIVNIYIRNFKECLKMVADEYTVKRNGTNKMTAKSRT